MNMNKVPNPNRSFFSIAAWYALIAPLAAAAIAGVGWLFFCFLIFNPGSCPVFDLVLGAVAFFLATSVIASIVSLFGIRRHGWRVIVWKSLVGFILSSLTFIAVSSFVANTFLQVMQVLTEPHPGVVGIELTKPDQSQPPRIEKVVPASPADDAGIKPGWFLLSVNGTNTAGKSLGETLGMIHGMAGKPVTFSLADSTQNKTTNITLLRQSYSAIEMRNAMRNAIGNYRIIETNH